MKTYVFLGRVPKLRDRHETIFSSRVRVDDQVKMFRHDNVSYKTNVETLMQDVQPVDNNAFHIVVPEER